MDIFSKIAAGEIPSYKCAENDKFYAFLDINPLVKGHTLVIPRREVDYIFDMDDDEIAGCGYQARIPMHQGRTGSTGAGSATRPHPPHPYAVGEGHAVQQSQAQA